MAAEPDTTPPTVETGCLAIVSVDGGKPLALPQPSLKVLNGPHVLTLDLQPGDSLKSIMCARDSALPVAADTRAPMQFMVPLFLGHDGLLVTLTRKDGLWQITRVSGPAWTPAQAAAFEAALTVLNEPLPAGPDGG